MNKQMLKESRSFWITLAITFMIFFISFLFFAPSFYHKIGYNKGVNDILNNYTCYEKYVPIFNDTYFSWGKEEFYTNPSFTIFNNPTIQISKDYCWEVTCPCAREQPACAVYYFECKEGAFDSLK